MFGRSDAPVEQPDDRLTMVFRSAGDGHRWTINGKSYPRTDPIVVEEGKRYRWTLDNQSAENHPVHLHRHTFEIVRVDGRPMSGVLKDVVVVPAWKQVEVDVPAVHPGLSLFHCHQQFHMDMGFMTMMRYAP
jgi:FtsP/CotA-like multicopper oxidase with cupredoxin domain